MTIGVFGGSFNPIHNAHINLARNLLEAVDLNEVWFVVSPQNPFKQQTDLMPDDLRLQMVSKALEDERRLKACDIEMRMPKPSYMWNTLQALGKEYPDHRFVLIIGSDNWERFSEWYRASDIIKQYDIVIYPRPGYAIDKATLPDNVTLTDTPQTDISSTEIRQRLQKGEDIGELVPPVVAKMLKERSKEQ